MDDEVIVSAWVVRGVVGDMGISQQESTVIKATSRVSGWGVPVNNE
jgi:hypothetical protein